MAARKKRSSRPRRDDDWPDLPLSGADRRHLRSLGNPLRVAVAVGRAGATDGVREEIARELGRHPLIKVKLGAPAAAEADGEGGGADALAAALASAAGAEVVARVGRTLLLYRPPEDDE